ncbi:UNVERIFIED_CONTAM: hypothetical protein FKN15_046787 [Acipenser sinensis]
MSRRPCPKSCPCTMPNTVPENKQCLDQEVQCDLGSSENCLPEECGSSSLPMPCLVGVEGPDEDAADDVSSDQPSNWPVMDSCDHSLEPSMQPTCTAKVSNTVGNPSELFTGWTMEHLREAQITDPDIGQVLKLKEQGGVQPKWSTISPFSSATKAYWTQWKRLQLRDGILVRLFYSQDGSQFQLQIILPREFHAGVMKQMHEGPVGGHFGVERTLSRIQTRYYWYKMREDITFWCQTCTSCAAKARPPKTPQALMGTVRVGAPMERIAMDLMGPLNETDRYNRYILVVQDYFTKWVEAYPLPDDKAVTVADTLTSEWVCRYGAPYTLHSDQGSNFESDVFQRMCELLGIEKTRTTPFRPQSDGQVERFNATLQKILATTAERCHWDWDIMIPFALMAYRATKHSSTGITPNMMFLGREITEPIDLVAGRPPDDESYLTQPEYVVKLREQMEQAHWIARDVLGQASERAKKQYHKRAQQFQYQIGDAVWYLVKGTRRVKNRVRKFLPAYDGPYFVLGQLDDLVYRIKKTPKTKAKVVHHDKLKPYKARTPLDNAWVFREAGVWSPVEVPPPILDPDPLDTDLNLSNLFDPPEVSRDSPQTPASPHRDQASGGSIVSPNSTSKKPKGSVNKDKTSASPPFVQNRSQRSRKPPNRYGDWVTN